ncbi:MAG: LTA synthase family protein [Clostridiales bacterium]|nr:MAG: LTA synthase family protein [Clostridiales bacterium]
MCYDKYFKYTILPKIDCKISGFDSANNYFSNGFILTFFPRIGELTVEKPEGYSKETLANLADTYAVMDVNAAKDKTKVNVIAIQCESWWDPTKLENVTMSEDPMKNIRALGEKYYFGDMVSPSFGCNTCIPEFEYLTFLSTNLLPEGGYPYSQYVRKPIYSLARIFKDNGYNALAIHTYDKNFYNRSKAYPLMGFDRLLGYTDLENPVKKGTYISDMYLSEQIIEKYEQSIDKPLFLYAVSMQNHGNYLVPRYGSYDVEVNSDALSAEDLSGLREAVQGIYDIDKAFMHLVDYFKKQKEPVLIVMYGDHLPFLGINSSTFKSLGFMKGDSTEQNPNMYETPYIVWANFDISQFDLKKRVGPQYLGVNTVKMANLKNVPWHFSFFDEFYTKHTVYQHTNVCDENGDYAPYESITDEEIANYKILQYNCLFGKENFVSDKSEKNKFIGCFFMKKSLQILSFIFFAAFLAVILVMNIINLWSGASVTGVSDVIIGVLYSLLMLALALCIKNAKNTGGKSRIFILLAIIFVGTAVRIWYVTFAKTVPISDYETMFNGAKSVASGDYSCFDKFTYFHRFVHMTTFTFVCGILFKIFGVSVLNIQLASAVFVGSLHFFIIYLIGKNQR